MKGIIENLVVYRFTKIFMLVSIVVGVIGGLVACVDETQMITPDNTAPEIIEPIVIEPPTGGSTCNDNDDNDLDSWLDDKDPDCFASATADEIGFSDYICNNGLDDDGDGLVDSDDPNCQNAVDDTEGMAVGDLLITEFMANPAATSDTSGEWFEVYNNTLADIDMNGWTISDAGGSHSIVDPLIIAAGDYAVFSRADNDVNGLSPIAGTDYIYGTSLYFSNSSDEIHIVDPQNVVIDSVVYAATNVTAGASTNINGENWCVSTVLITDGAGDYGTPGAENETCPE